MRLDSTMRVKIKFRGFLKFRLPDFLTVSFLFCIKKILFPQFIVFSRIFRELTMNDKFSATSLKLNKITPSIIKING